MSQARIAQWTIPIVILAIGVGVAAGLVATRPQPDIVPEESLGRLVRTFRAEPVSHRIAVKAYGTSRAAEEWSAIAEVSGRITLLEDNFEEGEILQANTLLATIDKLDYELAVSTAQTEVAAQQQQLVELTQSQANLGSIVELRQQQLTIAKSDLDRVRGLMNRGVGTEAEFDRVSTSYLDRQTSFQDLQNQLALIPIQEKSLTIAKEAAELRLQQARRDLERCDIRLPITSLCLSRNIDRHQQVSAGQQLGRFLALDRAEIVAMVEPRRAINLFPNLGKTFGPIDLRSQTTSLIRELHRQFDALQIPVEITWRAGEGEVKWHGKLVRASATIDESTRSIPLIIEVEDAFSEVQLGIKPALVPGMFVEVIIYGDVLEDVFVVPRDAVRDGSVYVVREGRLVIVPVEVAVLEEDLAVIRSGLEAGDQVVLADLFPAANGMLLRAQEVANPVAPRQELPDRSKQEGLVR